MSVSTDVRACPECGGGIRETTCIGSLLPGPDPNIATCDAGHRWWIRDGSRYVHGAARAMTIGPHGELRRADVPPSSFVRATPEENREALIEIAHHLRAKTEGNDE